MNYVSNRAVVRNRFFRETIQLLFRLGQLCSLLLIIGSGITRLNRHSDLKIKIPTVMNMNSNIQPSKTGYMITECKTFWGQAECGLVNGNFELAMQTGLEQPYIAHFSADPEGDMSVGDTYIPFQWEKLGLSFTKTEYQFGSTGSMTVLHTVIIELPLFIVLCVLYNIFGWVMTPEFRCSEKIRHYFSA